MDDRDSRAAALDYLKYYTENRNLNSAERNSIAAAMELLLGESELADDLRDMSRYLLFISAPDRIAGDQEQLALLNHMRRNVEGHGLGSEQAGERVRQSLGVLITAITSG